MSDDPKLPPVDGGEELDLGEIEEVEGQDAGLYGDEAVEEGDAPDEGGDGEEGADEEVDPSPRRRPGRSERLREKNAQLERELAEARGFRQAAEQLQRFQPQQQQVNAEAERVARWENENLPMMSAQEISAYYYNKGIQQTQQQMLMQQLQTEDRIDKRDFDQQARTSRVHSQYREEVERELNAERQRGNLRASRDDILHRLVGRDAVQRAARAAPAQRRSAQRRVEGQQTRPTNGRGDGASGGRRPAPGSPEHDEMLVQQYFQGGGRL